MNRRQIVSAAAAPMLIVSARAETSTRHMELHGAKASLEISTGDSGMAALVPRWIAKSSDAVARYYGRFPVPEVYIHVPVIAGKGVRGGMTMPGEMPLIRARVGENSGEDDLLRRDWVMVHEMIHLAFPYLDGAHNWMSEGIAVYVESIARVRAGHLPPEQIFADFARDMPKGLPAEGDRGLDLDDSWGRTYWGGALFCLLADVRIREETANRFGLQHALRAINAERDFRREWPFGETLEIGDRATGRGVLASLYAELRDKPVSPDLDDLWRQLGVVAQGATVAFDAAAPMAKIREAIVAA